MTVLSLINTAQGVLSVIGAVVMAALMLLSRDWRVRQLAKVDDADAKKAWADLGTTGWYLPFMFLVGGLRGFALTGAPDWLLIAVTAFVVVLLTLFVIHLAESALRIRQHLKRRSCQNP